MPLPTGQMAWPPLPLSDITAKLVEWDAWYSGDVQRLSNVYMHQGNRNLGRPSERAGQYAGGVVGAMSRFFWGRPKGSLLSNTNQDQLHVPLAADLCQAGADLLYADAPSFTSKNNAVQTELDLLVERGLVTTLASASEIGAALGDSYLRVTWDDTIADKAFVTPVDADAAWPEFRWGELVAVTFWWTVEKTETTVTRHLERHELDGDGPDADGVVYHGLYQGTPTELGRVVPLIEHPSTLPLAKLVNADGFISTKTPGLAVVHVPNQSPQRRWRSHPIGRSLGRSDLDGCEPMLDKLDMTWSSLMRDIRLAKSRLIVPNFMLTGNGPGDGALFDTDSDIYSSLNAPPREDDRMEITPQQFDIRTEQHFKTIDELVGEILQHAGYGEQTFGGTGDVAQTATEVDSRDRRSNLTRDRKIRATQPKVIKLLRKVMAVDNQFFHTGVDAEADLEMKFVDASQVSPLQLAQTTQALWTAQSASTEVRVRMLHPDWDEKAIKAEAEAVKAEFSTAVPDPATLRPGVPDQNQPPIPGVDDSQED